jgi:hypothetical protein
MASTFFTRFGSIPAVVGEGAITYYVPPLSQRAWTSWLLIMPISGLVVLGYSLNIWFTTQRNLMFGAAYAFTDLWLNFPQPRPAPDKLGCP